MSEALTLWIVIVVVGVLTYLSRLSFIALFARVEMPPFMVRALRYVPAAMLAAIVVPPVLMVGSGPLGFSPARLIATLVAAAVAWRTHNGTATMAAGMVTFWLAQGLLRLAAA